MSLTTDLFGGQDPNAAWNKVEQAPTASSEAYQAQKDNAVSYNPTSVAGGNAYAGVTGDQGGQDAERQSLAQLQQQSQGGLNAGDKAKLFQTQQAAGAQAKGQQDAILQGASQRGQGNSGASLAAQLAAQQSGQEAGANALADVASNASDRSLQATKDAASLGGQLDAATTGRQSAMAGASQQQQLANMQAANQASANNATAQNSANQFNVNQNTAQQQFMAQLMQQEYENQLQKAAGESGTALGQEGVDASTAGKIAGGVGSALGSFFSEGGSVPGHAKVAGNSLKNDTVPAMLSPGEIVISRETLHGGPDKILDFLEHETGMCFERATGKKDGK